ncbi:DinB family protein [Arundinibacter roseus]|nr:DinB family protein [Arundinibacter roseus]
MKKLLLYLFFMGIVSQGIAQENVGYLTEIQQKWANAKTYTLALADSMSADQYDFRPVPDEMTFAEQLTHLSGNMIWLCSSYLGTEKPPFTAKELAGFKDKSKSEIIDILNISFEYTQGVLKTVQPGELNEEVKFFAGPMTKRQILTLMNDHLTHHRAQAIVYLRLNGATPPRYVGW